MAGKNGSDDSGPAGTRAATLSGPTSVEQTDHAKTTSMTPTIVYTFYTTVDSTENGRERATHKTDRIEHSPRKPSFSQMTARRF